MPSPLVSVIIATYNWSPVLPYAIGSVLSQTMLDFELIVVGDHCSDDSEQVVSAIKDPRVKWINLPINTGHQAGPNNRGLQEAKGEFIAYLGHDDLWLPHHLQCMTDTLEETGGDVAHSLVLSIAANKETASPVLPMPQYGIPGPPSCSVYRRSVTDRIGGWRDYREMKMPPEIDIFRRAQAAGFKVVFVPRLTTIKLPALHRKDVYRDRPCHEQAYWSNRIHSDQNFEAVQLARMIASGEVTRALPVRQLIRILAEELMKRISWRLTRISGHKAIFWSGKGAGIDSQKKYKGL